MRRRDQSRQYTAGRQRIWPASHSVESKTPNFVLISLWILIDCRTEWSGSRLFRNRDADGIVYAQLQLQTAHRMGRLCVVCACVDIERKVNFHRKTFRWINLRNSHKNTRFLSHTPSSTSAIIHFPSDSIRFGLKTSSYICSGDSEHMFVPDEW